jgi:predicted dehydrogenase
MIAFARQQKVKFMVGHVVRFMPAYRRLREWIDSEEYGKLRFISLTRFSGLPSWGQWTEKQKNFGSSGGALFDLVIHDIDFLNYALGAPDKIECSTFPGALSMHDYVIATWTYKEVIAKVEGGNTFHSSFPFQAGYMAKFDNASVAYSSIAPEFIQICNDEAITKVAAGDAGDGFYNEIDYFAQCIENGTDPKVCMPESSLKTIELCYQHL